MQVQSFRPGGSLVGVIITPMIDPDPVPKTGGRFALVLLREGLADVVRGEVPDTGERTPVIHVGSTLGKHYYSSHDDRTIPYDVLDAVRQKGYQLVEDVDGGWDSWEGRPEFSTAYLDCRDATVVDMDARIAERLEDRDE